VHKRPWPPYATAPVSTIRSNPRIAGLTSQKCPGIRRPRLFVSDLNQLVEGLAPCCAAYVRRRALCAARGSGHGEKMTLRGKSRVTEVCPRIFAAVTSRFVRETQPGRGRAMGSAICIARESSARTHLSAFLSVMACSRNRLGGRRVVFFASLAPAREGGARSLPPAAAACAGGRRKQPPVTNTAAIFDAVAACAGRLAPRRRVDSARAAT